MDCRDNVGNGLSAAGAHSNLRRLECVAYQREFQRVKVGRMSSWSDEGWVMPVYVAGDATLGEVTLDEAKELSVMAGTGTVSMHSGL
jgi:hypothetical protein